jgi:hypothetical protein
MKCAHDQYRSVATRHDRGRGTLVYFWRCDCCGAHLGEHGRVNYRPRYERRSFDTSSGDRVERTALND